MSKVFIPDLSNFETLQPIVDPKKARSAGRENFETILEFGSEEETDSSKTSDFSTFCDRFRQHFTLITYGCNQISGAWAQR
jgi:hypothetical protein